MFYIKNYFYPFLPLLCWMASCSIPSCFLLPSTTDNSNWTVLHLINDSDDSRVQGYWCTWFHFSYNEAAIPRLPLKLVDFFCFISHCSNIITILNQYQKKRDNISEECMKRLAI